MSLYGGGKGSRNSPQQSGYGILLFSQAAGGSEPRPTGHSFGSVWLCQGIPVWLSDNLQALGTLAFTPVLIKWDSGEVGVFLSILTEPRQATPSAQWSPSILLTSPRLSYPQLTFPEHRPHGQAGLYS